MLMLIALTGCGKPQPKTPLESLLQRTCLKERVLVEFVTPIDPLSLLLTLHQDGRISHDGSFLSLDGVRELVSGPTRAPETAEKNTSPILIEAHPDVRLQSFKALLSVIIEKCRCVNISLLAVTVNGPGGVTVPIGEDYCPSAYCTYDGSWRFFEEHARFRTWLYAIGKEGGGIRVCGLDWKRNNLEIYFPEAGKPQPPKPEEEKILDNLTPELPSWDSKTIGQFFKNPPIPGDDPRIEIDTTPGLTISDFLKVLSSLRAAAGEHAVLGCKMWWRANDKPNQKNDVKK
jgi:hypothetical protein